MDIKRIREACGMTQREFAADVQITERTLSRWENAGKTIVDLHSVFAKNVRQVARRHHVEVER